MLLDLVLDDAHAQRADLEVRDDAVELSETRETEEDVDDVRSKLRVLLPVLP